MKTKLFAIMSTIIVLLASCSFSHKEENVPFKEVLSQDIHLPNYEVWHLLVLSSNIDSSYLIKFTTDEKIPSNTIYVEEKKNFPVNHSNYVVDSIISNSWIFTDQNIEWTIGEPKGNTMYWKLTGEGRADYEFWSPLRHHTTIDIMVKSPYKSDQSVARVEFFVNPNHVVLWIPEKVTN